MRLIGEKAFSQTSIESISIPKKVTKILSHSFHNCRNLNSIFFSEQSELTFIGEYAFCFSSIQSINIPNKVKSIGRYCFDCCENLKEVNFSEDSKLQCIRSNTFQSCAIERFKVPPHVFLIKTNAFFFCEKLKTIEFSANSKIYRIETNCFYFTSIENITIPSRVVELENGWCKNLQHLNNVKIIPTKKRIDYYENKFIIGKSNPRKNCLNSLILAARNLIHVTIPSFIKRISSYAFQFCENLENLTFEDNSKLELIDQFAFQYSGIKNITIPANVIEIGENAFASSSLENITFSNESKLKYIDQSAFENTCLTCVNIPSHVEIIGSYAFNCCEKLTNIFFDEDSELEIIGSGAFYQTNLESINIPTSVKKVGESVFSKCQNLKNVTFLENSQIIKFTNNIFAESSLNSFTIPSSVVALDEKWNYSSNLTNVNVHPNNKHFSNYLEEFILTKTNQEKDDFDTLVYSKKNIQKVMIPSCIKEIAPFTFSYYESIESVEFIQNSHLKLIGAESFKYSSIRNITFPSSLIKIDHHAFFNCFNLETISFPEDSQLKYICDGAFISTSIKTFKVPSNVERIETESFGSCFQLLKIEFDKNSKVESFEREAFQYSKLHTIEIPPKLKELKPGWCICVDELSKILVSPLNKNFILYDNKFLLGKSNSNKEIYDILHFACRDIEIAFIPSFITKIADNAFMNCNKLCKIDFANDSQLKLIGESAFINNGFESISIPQHVAEIEKYAFESSKIKYITFSDISELKCIGCLAFDQSLFSSISIPSQVDKIKQAFYNCENATIFEIDEKSSLNSFDFTDRNLNSGIIMVPVSLFKSFIC